MRRDKQWKTNLNDTRAFARLVLAELVQAGIPTAKFRHGLVMKGGGGIIVTPSASTRQVLIEPKYPSGLVDSGEQGRRLLLASLGVVHTLLAPAVRGDVSMYAWRVKDPIMPMVVVSVPPRSILDRLKPRSGNK